MALGLSVFGVSLIYATLTPAEPLPLPSVFTKAIPEDVDDLIAIQQQVKKVITVAMPVTVGIQIGPIQGSGVIVSKDGYVLTAGHVSGEPNRAAEIILPNGKKLKAKTLGNNGEIDSGMLQITQEGEYPFADIGVSADLKKGQWIIAIGHPGGFQKGRSPVVRVGCVLDVTKDFIRTDAALVGGDSGGPLFNMAGEVVGIHSRIGDKLTSNVHVPADTYKLTWDRLAKGEVWGEKSLFAKGKGKGKAPAEPYVGLAFDQTQKAVKVATVNPNSPADKAGLKINDILTMVDGKKIASVDDWINALRTKRPGETLAIQAARGEETISVTITVIARPS